MKASHARTRQTEAQAVAGLLDALQHGDRLMSAVESLVRASREMLDAFNRGDPEGFSSMAMESALASFEGWEPHVDIRGW